MQTSNQHKYKRLGPLQLAAVIFLTVSGGPYGLEPLLYYVGKSGALLLLMIVPLLWDIPTIFTVLELNSMMPVNGGYYEWVKRAMGKRFAFYEGWWTWLYTFVDLAIYPVLFVEYAAFFFPWLADYKVPVCLFIIWLSAALNILGIVPVGKISILLTAIVLIPFFIFFVVGFSHQHNTVSFSSLSLKGVGFSSVGLGLYTVMWNFMGWDNATTYAGEVDKPIRSYLISVAVAFSIVFAIYFATTVIAQNSGFSFARLNDEGFPSLGAALGGHWLGVLLSVGGMASTLGLFSAVLLSVSRVPKVMADDKLLSPKLSALHPKFNTPYISIIICAIVVSLMILWKFDELIVIDVSLYGAALSLEFIALIILRIKAPDEHRPFKIPFGIKGLCLMTLLPLSVYVIAITAEFTVSKRAPIFFAVAALLSAELGWRIIKWRNPRVVD
jgi:amino acid transporter